MSVDVMVGPPEIPAVDPLSFPLFGSQLIEASAGTGKTWTIAALYVRLILGHGGQAARLPAQVLVLTFTDAAAAELRDRIRARLAQAALCFAASDGEPPLDDFFAELRASYAPAQWPTCAQLLDLAAQSMDEAAISTIHGWCARVLHEHAFDSASLFEQQLLRDLTELTRQMAWDYWRSCVASLQGQALAQVLTVWRSPDDLHQALGKLLTREDLPPGDGVSLGQVCEQFLAHRQVQVMALKAQWVDRVPELSAWVEQHAAHLNMHSLRRWLGDLQAWAEQSEPEVPALTAKAWEVLSTDGLRARWKADTPMSRLPAACDELPDLQTALKQLPTISAPAREHALAWMAVRLAHHLHSLGAMGFDGLLKGLDSALHGPRGDALAQTLRQQFPVVMIDEFQDTDPVQYRIFDRIYQVADPLPDTALVLIGDPKQAIYSFRGADVQTYLRAAHACAGHVHTLWRNFRATDPMVQAVNHCFDRTQGEPVFPTATPGVGLDFYTVSAQGRDEVWTLQGQPAPAMQACWLAAAEGHLTVTEHDVRASAACAQQVARWLRLGQLQQAGFQGPTDFRPVRPSDVAVLVNSWAEAAHIRQALAAQGIRSVYLSDRRSVYESPCALEFELVLAACARPNEERAIRAALATPLLGMELADLARLTQDEWAWDEQVERFQRYHEDWHRRGVLPMVRRVLHDFAVPARLLAQGPEGERLLTDCLHLAELLQQASVQLDGEQALLTYLGRQRSLSAVDAQGEDARRLRLESDEALVRVVTVHKSKGLEYPLVCLPFISRGLNPARKSQPESLHWQGRRQWVLDPGPEAQAQLALEQLGEETRKCYVALTRARYAVWMALADTGRRSGIGHVLGADLQVAWQQRCEAHPAQFAWDTQSDQTAPAVGMGDDVPDASRDALPEVSPVSSPEACRVALGHARALDSPVVRTPWWIASYSALNLAHGADRPQRTVRDWPETAADEVLRESLRHPAAPVSRVRAISGPADLLSFPRGSEAGTFLHGLLEWAGQRRFCELDGLRDLVARRCAVRGWESHIDLLTDWLSQFVGTVWRPDLPGAPTWRLDRLSACLPEMEFWLPVHQVAVSALDRCITQGAWPGHARPALLADQLNGMFKGFIDLCLCVEGRYFLIDYKSNDLGADLADYHADALIEAMCAARYDVQMLLYVLALHRQLRARLPDYDYARHMGGAVYQFLRGQSAAGQGLLSWCPPQALIESLDALFTGQEVTYAG